MKWSKNWLKDLYFVILMESAAFALNLVLVEKFEADTTIESVFVLAAFLVALRTEGYFWGIAASLVGVLVVNYTFTYPYWAFDLISPECISAAIVMLVVAIMTSALTTQIKHQEKMKAEAERERMRGNLLRAVSHDLRTPLTSIYGACSTMLESYDSIPKEKHIKMLRDVQSDAQWLVRMVENLLSITRIGADQVQLNKQDTVLEEVLDAVLVKFHKHYPSQKIELLLPDEVLVIPMDPILIEQVLMNLLENAVLHAEGMTHLWLRVKHKGSRVFFHVEDDGCGIQPDRREHLFSGRLDSSSPMDSSRSSMGIGLSVCSAIIKAHGGEITAGDRPGGGAQFRFSLDMEDQHE